MSPTRALSWERARRVLVYTPLEWVCGGSTLRVTLDLRWAAFSESVAFCCRLVLVVSHPILLGGGVMLTMIVLGLESRTRGSLSLLFTSCGSARTSPRARSAWAWEPSGVSVLVVQLYTGLLVNGSPIVVRRS